MRTNQVFKILFILDPSSLSGLILYLAHPRNTKLEVIRSTCLFSHTAWNITGVKNVC